MGETNGGQGQQTGGTGAGDGGQGNTPPPTTTNTQQGQQGGTGDGGQGQQTGGTGQGGQQGAENVESLPAWAQKLVRDARSEAASARTSAKQAAAQEAQAALLQQLGKALGFVKDEALTPQQLEAKLAEVSGRHRESLVQLGVLRAAAKAKADPEALLDSRAFLASLKDLDPASESFGGQLEAAIEKAVKDNPRLAAGTPVGSGGGEIRGGTGDKPDGEGWDDIMKSVRRGRTR